MNPELFQTLIAGMLASNREKDNQEQESLPAEEEGLSNGENPMMELLSDILTKGNEERE